MRGRRVFYLDTLKAQLPRIAEGGSLASVLEHCMYCGMSLGRVGLDFRGLLVPLFEQEVLRLFSTSVKVRPRPHKAGLCQFRQVTPVFLLHSLSSSSCPALNHVLLRLTPHATAVACAQQGDKILP